MSIGAQASIEALPMIGGALATLIFEGQKTKRFKRLERFYEELGERLDEVGEDLADVIEESAEASDPERLRSIFDRLHEEVASEELDEKRERYKTYFENALSSPVTEENYEGKRLVLDCLARLTPAQLSIVASLAKSGEWTEPRQISVEGIGSEYVEGALGMLKSYGVLDERIDSISATSGAGGIQQATRVRLSGFGYRLHDICLARDGKARSGGQGGSTSKNGFYMQPVPGEDGVWQSQVFEVSNTELLRWLNTLNLRERDVKNVIEQRRERSLEFRHLSVRVRIRPHGSNAWRLDWRYEGDLKDMTLSASLGEILSGKEPVSQA